MTGINYDALVEVFRGNLWEAEIVKGLLESEGVQAMIKDESLSIITSSYNSVGGMVKVLVNQEEEVYAKKVVARRRE